MPTAGGGWEWVTPPPPLLGGSLCLTLLLRRLQGGSAEAGERLLLALAVFLWLFVPAAAAADQPVRLRSSVRGQKADSWCFRKTGGTGATLACQPELAPIRCIRPLASKSILPDSVLDQVGK